MALIKCPECASEISSVAESCPHCGFPVAKFLADRAREERAAAARERAARQAEAIKAAKAKSDKRKTIGLVAMIALIGGCCFLMFVVSEIEGCQAERAAEAERIAEEERRAERLADLRGNLSAFLAEVDSYLEESALEEADGLIGELEMAMPSDTGVHERRDQLEALIRGPILEEIDELLESEQHQDAEPLLEQLERRVGDNEEVQQRRAIFDDLEGQRIAEYHLVRGQQRLDEAQSSGRDGQWVIAQAILSDALDGLDEVPEDYLQDEHHALHRSIERALDDAMPRAEAEREEERARAAAAAAPRGQWRVRTEQSAMDDSVNVFLTLRSENQIEDWIGQRHRAILVVRCVENRTSAIMQLGMSPNPELGNYDRAHARIRLDDSDAVRVNMSQSTTGESLFFPGTTRYPRRFLGAERMRFEFTPFRQGSRIFEFDLTGYDRVLPQVQEACNW